MDIEVIGKSFFTVHLTEEDVEKMKQFIKDNPERYRYMKPKDCITDAAMELYNNGDIEFFEPSKATESEFSTEEAVWSEFEPQTPEEILGAELCAKLEEGMTEGYSN